MHAIRARFTSGKPELQLIEQQQPEQHPQQLLVRVTYAAATRYDAESLQDATLALSDTKIPGIQGCGRVVHDPRGEITPGTCVAWWGERGSWASYVTVSRESIVAVPDVVPHDVAATMLDAGMLASVKFHKLRHLERGEAIIVTDIDDLVGRFLVAFGSLLEHVVFALVRNETEAELAMALGATQVFLPQKDLTRKLTRSNDGIGANAVFASLDTCSLQQAIRLAQPQALVSLYGSLGNTRTSLEMMRAGGSVLLAAPKLSDFIHSHEDFRFHAQNVTRCLEDTDPTLFRAKSFALQDVEPALQYVLQTPASHVTLAIEPTKI